MYGNEQAQYTMNRAAYGEVPAAMMAGSSTIYGGAAMGMHNMLGDVGGLVMPVGYMPPTRVNVGFYGQYQQQMGFLSSMSATFGFGSPGRSQMAADYGYNVASDFGERVGGGLAGVGMSIASMGVGTAMGKMLGGGIVGSLAGGLAGMAAAGVVMDSVGQRRDISNFLESSSFRYATTSSGLGDHGRSGFGSRARTQVTDMIRGMDFKDPFMSTEDLTMVLQQGTQKGLFAGTGGMEDFKKKFKDLVDTVKVTTRTLNQSLEEAMSTIKELKSVGIDPGQASKVIGSADMLGRMAGRTGAEMLNIGLQGAEMFRGTGVTMGIGAQATMMNLASIRAARDAGQISTEAIAQAGGEEAMAMRQNAQGLSFAQSQVGRGMGAAFFKGGGLDQNAFMQQMLGGGKGLVDLAQQAAQNLSDPAKLMSYQANQAKFMSEMGKTFGGQGLQIAQLKTYMTQAAYLHGVMPNLSMEDAARLSMLQGGMGESDIDAAFGQMRGAGAINKSANKAAQMAYGRAAMEEGYRSSPFANLGSRVRDIGKQVIEPYSATIGNMIEYAKDSLVSFHQEQAYGTRIADISGRDLSITIPGVKTEVATVKDLDKGGWLGGQTAGSQLKRSLSKEMQRTLGVTVNQIGSSEDLASGDVIIKNHAAASLYSVGGLAASALGFSSPVGSSESISKKSISKIAALSFTPEEYEKAKKSGELDKVKGWDLNSILSYNGPTGEDRTANLVQAAGRGEELTKLRAMKLQDTIEKSGSDSLKTDYKGLSSLLSNASNAEHALTSESIIQASKQLGATETLIKGAAMFSVGGNPLTGMGHIANVMKLTPKAIQMASLASHTGKESDRLAAVAATINGTGIDTEDAKKLVDNMMSHKDLMKTYAVANNQLQAAASEGGSSAMKDRLVDSARLADFSVGDTAVVSNAAGKLAKATSQEDFSNIAAENADILKKTDAGRNIVDTAELLADIGKGKYKKVSEVKEKLGDKFTSRIGELIQQGDWGGAAQEGYNAFKTQEASQVQVNGPGGTKTEGGTATAQQTLSQQVQINDSILAAFRAMADQLGKGKGQ